MSTKKQRKASKKIGKDLLQSAESMRQHLSTLESIYATEHCDEARAKELSERARQAASSFAKVRDSLEEERLDEVGGSPELYWKSKVYSIDDKNMWKKMRIAELRERTRLLKRVGEKFRSMLPESVVDRLSLAENSPGEIVLELSGIHSRNHELAQEALRLEEEEERLQRALDADRVSFSNVSALSGLSAFEKEVLDTLPNIPQKKSNRVAGFGLNYLSEVSSKRETLDLRLRGMESEMVRLRSVTVAAINAVEGGGERSEGRKLLDECEEAASEFIRYRG